MWDSNLHVHVHVGHLDQVSYQLIIPTKLSSSICLVVCCQSKSSISSLDIEAVDLFLVSSFAPSNLDWFPVFILTRIETGSGHTFRGFHWIRCAEGLPSCFEARLRM